MKTSIKDTLPFAEAFARLLHPFAEVVVHDLEKDQIEAIYNPLSRREVGDSSYLDRIEFGDHENVIGPYKKTNWDGRTLKSISTLIRNKTGRVEGFLCVNMDISIFESTSQLIGQFLANQSDMAERDETLFRGDVYEKINRYIQNYCRKKQVSLEALNRKEKRQLVGLMAKEGAFEQSNAAIYIGRILGVSRATVYNYLKGTHL